MDFAESPPAQKKVLLLRAREIFLKLLQLAITFHLPLDFALQRFDESRNGHQHGNTLVANHFNQAGRLERINQDHGAGEERRDQDTQHLAEDVAQWKQIQEAQRVKNALVVKIFLDFTLDGLDVGKDVAVRDHHAARFCRGAEVKMISSVSWRERGGAGYGEESPCSVSSESDSRMMEFSGSLASASARP